MRPSLLIFYTSMSVPCLTASPHYASSKSLPKTRSVIPNATGRTATGSEAPILIAQSLSSPRRGSPYVGSSFGKAGITGEVIVFKGTSDPVLGHAFGKSRDTECCRNGKHTSITQHANIVERCFYSFEHVANCDLCSVHSVTCKMSFLLGRGAGEGKETVTELVFNDA